MLNEPLFYLFLIIFSLVVSLRFISSLRIQLLYNILSVVAYVYTFYTLFQFNLMLLSLFSSLFLLIGIYKDYKLRYSLLISPLSFSLFFLVPFLSFVFSKLIF